VCNRTGTVGQLRRPGFDFVKGCGGSADSCILNRCTREWMEN
jgi:hypothetical protein